MAAIETMICDRRKAGARANKKHSPKMDMTPMVDLGFLLISFFVITTELSKPAVLQLNMPKNGPPTDLGNSNALTVLLEKNNSIYYYHGNWSDAVSANEIFKINFSKKAELREVIHEKQQKLDLINKKEGRNGLMLLIKPGDQADYSNVIDMLDEALINNIKKYTVLKQEEEEKKYLAAIK